MSNAAPAPVLTAASLQIRCIAESLAAASARLRVMLDEGAPKGAVRGQAARIAALRAEMAEVQ
jgi:hypothetical protein